MTLVNTYLKTDRFMQQHEIEDEIVDEVTDHDDIID